MCQDGEWTQGDLTCVSEMEIEKNDISPNLGNGKIMPNVSEKFLTVMCIGLWKCLLRRGAGGYVCVAGSGARMEPTPVQGQLKWNLTKNMLQDKLSTMGLPLSQGTKLNHPSSPFHH